jgi:hypothetical protein
VCKFLRLVLRNLTKLTTSMKIKDLERAYHYWENNPFEIVAEYVDVLQFPYLSRKGVFFLCP